MAKVAYRTWVTDELVTADMMNEQVRDNGNALWPYTTKGDIGVATAADTLARLPVGADGTALVANSSEATGVKWQATVCAKVYRSTQQTFTTAVEDQISSFDSESYDAFGFHTGTTNYLEVPTGMAGFYICGCSAYWDSHATASKLRQIGIQKNNSNVGLNSTVSDSGSAIWQQATWAGYLIAGDQIKMDAVQKSGGNLDLYEATLWMVRVL